MRGGGRPSLVERSVRFRGSSCGGRSLGGASPLVFFDSAQSILRKDEAKPAIALRTSEVPFIRFGNAIEVVGYDRIAAIHLGGGCWRRSYQLQVGDSPRSLIGDGLFERLSLGGANSEAFD